MHCTESNDTKQLRQIADARGFYIRVHFLSYSGTTGIINRRQACWFMLLHVLFFCSFFSFLLPSQPFSFLFSVVSLLVFSLYFLFTSLHFSRLLLFYCLFSLFCFFFPLLIISLFPYLLLFRFWFCCIYVVSDCHKLTSFLSPQEQYWSRVKKAKRRVSTSNNPEKD